MTAATSKVGRADPGLIDTLLIEAGPGEVRGARLSAGRVWDVDHFRAATPDCRGAIYQGRVRRIDPGMNAAFVEIGGGWEKDGFLRARDAGAGGKSPRKNLRIGQTVHEGAMILVQITGGQTVRAGGAGDEVKGPQLSTAITVPAPGFDYLPTRPGFFIGANRSTTDLGDLLTDEEGVRLPGLDFEPGALGEAIGAGLAVARQRWAEIQAAAKSHNGVGCIVPPADPIVRFLADFAAGRSAGDPRPRIIVGDPGLLKLARDWCTVFAPDLLASLEQARLGTRPFAEFDVDGEIEAALGRETVVQFGAQSGARLIFEPGETLCAIDVNSSAALGKAGRQAVDTNLAAIPEIARQIRLRGLAGAIVIDFLKMHRAADRDRVVASMAASTAHDPAGVTVLGLSPLGHLELTRARRKPSLAANLLAQPQPVTNLDPSAEAACYAALRDLVAAGMGRADVPVLHAGPAMAALLSPGGRLAFAADAVGAQLGQALILETDADLAPGAFRCG